MTVRRTNLILWTVCGLFAASSLLSLLFAFAVPIHFRPVDVYAGSAKSPAVSAVKLLSAQSVAAIYARPFRQSLDGSTVAANPSTRPADATSATEIELDGTIGSGLAILKGPDGSQALAEVGDDVNGAVIVAIRPTEIDLRNTDGSIITLRRPAENDPGFVSPSAPPPAPPSAP